MWRAAPIALITTISMLIAARPARADIVNVQSALATEADQGLSGSVTGAADWRQGNSERLTLGLSPVARYRSGKHLIIGLLRGELFRAGDGEFDRKIFEHLRYRYFFGDRLLGEVFAQHEFNEVRRLSLRALVGFGPKYQLVDSDRVQVGVGVAYMLEYEKLQDDWVIDSDSSEGDAVNHRISSYLTCSYELDKDRLQLVQTLYAQPAATSPDDIRLLSESHVVVKVTKSIALTTSFVLAIDSKPPVDTTGMEPDVETYDTTLKTSLTYSF